VDPEQVLLKLDCDDNTITSALSSSVEDSLSELEGRPLQDFLGDCSCSDRYSLTRIVVDGRKRTCAVRMDDNRTLFVYYVKDDSNCPAGATVPAARLTPGSHLPTVSPGLVSLLGYTPWELASSDLLEKLVRQTPGEPVRLTIVDKWGGNRSLICTIYPSNIDGVDIFFTSLPPDTAPSLHSLINRWEQMPLSCPDDLLSFLLDALGASQGAVLTNTDGEYRVLASRDLDLDPDDPDQKSLFCAVSSSVPAWLDTGSVLDHDLEGGHALVYPFGRNRSYLFIAPFQGEAGKINEKIEALLPVMSMRLDLWELSSGGDVSGSVSASGSIEPDDESMASISFEGSGTSIYNADGFIMSWSPWLEDATAIRATNAVGQPAGRLLDRIGSAKLTEQYEHALRDTLYDEPVEFPFQGRKCFSYISRHSDGTSLVHKVVDMGILAVNPCPGVATPGTYAISGNPASAADVLTDAAGITGWEYDMSPDTTVSGTPIWLSHGTGVDMLVHMMQLLSPFCPDHWVGLTATVIDQDDESSHLLLPGVYHVLSFRTLPVMMPAQIALLERLNGQIGALGCSLTRSEADDSLFLAIPSALSPGSNMDLVIYSSDSRFLVTCSDLFSKVAESWHVADSLGSLARLQDKARALVLRLHPFELPIVNALLARLPYQPMLVISGQTSAIPLLGTEVDLQQLPIDDKRILMALRRLLR